jgi:hypothetical protein
MAPIRIVIRSLAGESTEIELQASATIAELKQVIQAATQIPVVEQRLVFAGTQLEEAASEAWRRRRSGNESSALSAALGVESIPDGAPLTLEHYAIQKGSVVNIVRRIASSAPAEPDALARGQTVENVAPSRPPEPAPEPSLPPPSREDPDVVAQIRARGSASQKAPENAPPPVLEFMEPEPRNQPTSGRPSPIGNGGYGVPGMNGGRDQASEGLISRLDGMDDVALYHLLNPLLNRRPRLKESLLQAPQAREERSSADSVAAASVNQAWRSQGLGEQSRPAEKREFRRGDHVYVFSNSAQRWCEGTVLQVSKEKSGKIPQGAVEVSFELGQKWIAPQDAPKILRPR